MCFTHALIIYSKQILRAGCKVEVSISDVDMMSSARDQAGCPCEFAAVYESQVLGGGHRVYRQGPGLPALWSLLPCTNSRVNEVDAMSTARVPRGCTRCPWPGTKPAYAFENVTVLQSQGLGGGYDIRDSPLDLWSLSPCINRRF